MKRDEVFPAIIDALRGNSRLVTLLGSAERIIPVDADLPAMFPAVCLQYNETGSKRRCGYVSNKTRDCVGELDIIIQVATIPDDVIAVEKIIDEILFTDVSGTRGWERTHNDHNSMNSEKLAGVACYGQDIYRFEYTVIDP
jgi:hypothetical protein